MLETGVVGVKKKKKKKHSVLKMSLYTLAQSE